MDEDAEGRRRRGLIIAAVVFVVGAPLLTFDWISDRNVDRQARQLAEDLRAAAAEIGDVSALAADETVSLWSGEPSAVGQALGHEDEFEGATYGGDTITAAFSTRWAMATRCVHLVIEDEEVIIDITDDRRCAPRRSGD